MSIFTDDFLEVNKGREGELRQLRKTVGDLEEQTVALRHYVSSLEETLSYLETSCNEYNRLNCDLSRYLVDLSTVVVESFGKLKLPECGTLTHGNLGKYTEELVKISDSTGKSKNDILKLAREIAMSIKLPS